MILDVKLIKNAYIYCTESAFATVANWLKRDYRMIFSGMIGFDYLEENDKGRKKIGERIRCSISMEDIVYALQYYHGIIAENKKVEANIMEIVIKQINQKIPILTYVSPQFCSWTSEQVCKIYFLIIGYDEEFVYGYDLHNDSDNVEKLAISKLEKCYTENGDIQIYKIVDSEKNVDFEELKKIIQRRYDLNQTYEKIEKMANELQEGYNREFVNESYIEFRQMPIFVRLVDVVRGRKLFAKACYYIAEKNGNEFAQYVGDCYAEIGEQWAIAWNMLAKAYIINCNENMERKIGGIINDAIDRIKKAAEIEKKLICNIFGECQIKEKRVKVANKIKEDIGYEYTNVNIEKLFNNKAFSGGNTKIHADMTGYGEFFMPGELPVNRSITIGKTDFYINTEYDNLICNNQMIRVKSDRYKKIYILGCAEWGAGSGKVRIGNNDYSEVLWLEFPDWYYCKMNRGNGWSGRAIDYEGHEVERGMFCLDYELNENTIISWLKLPKIHNVHIFGVKLLK